MAERTLLVLNVQLLTAALHMGVTTHHDDSALHQVRYSVHACLPSTAGGRCRWRHVQGREQTPPGCLTASKHKGDPAPRSHL